MDELLLPDATAVEEVSRYRAALLGDRSTTELRSLATRMEPELVAVLELIDTARRDQSSPDPVFADRLHQQLLATANRSRLHLLASPVAAPIAGRPAPSPESPSASRPWVGAWVPRAGGHLLTAGLILVLLLVGMALSGRGDLLIATLLTDAPVRLAAPIVSKGHLEFLWESAGGPEGFRRAYGMAIDPDGQLWVADAGAQQITILAPDGTVRETWGEAGEGPGQFNFFGTYVADGNPRADIAFDARGNIYVTDAGNHRLQKFGPDRQFLRAWGREGTADGEFLAPTSIAIDAGGTLYVSDALRNDIQLFDADGAFLGLFGSDGDGARQLSTPTAVAIDGDGDLWVANFGGDRIQRYTPACELLTSWGMTGSNAGELADPTDVAVDDAGRVYVLDQNNRRVQVFAADGQFLAAVGSFGGGPGFFNQPAGLALDEAGGVYVSDRYSVQAFRAVFPPWAQLLP